MDISESPTQANDDRDYETECHLPLDTTDPLTSPGNHHGTNQSDADELRTLQEGDTGAVNFVPLSQDGKDMSQESDILSPFAENPILQRGDWRGQRASQRLGTTPARPSTMAAPPETPAGPVNPFGARQRPASVLRATQLFNATQFSSGGVKKFSPTSSRPSPHAFHQTFPTDTSPAGLLTSPLKNRTTSSPSIFRKSSPPRVQIPSTSFAELPPSRSPPHQYSSRDEEAIPESPPGDPDPSPPRKRQRQELLEDYEPVAVSQQRKLMSDELNKVSDSDSGEDDDLRRRRLARQKREQAERRLNDISFVPPPRDTATNARSLRKRNTRRGGRLFTNEANLDDERNELASRRRPSSASGQPFETPSNVRFASVPPQEHSSIDNRRNMTSPAEAQEQIPPTSSPLVAQAPDLEPSERSSPPLKPQPPESSNTPSSVSLPVQLPPSSQVSKRKYGFRRVAGRTSSKMLVPESPMVVPESDLAQGQGGVPISGGEGDEDDDTVLAPGTNSGDTTRSRSPVLDDLPPTQPPPPATQTETRESRQEEDTVVEEPEAVQTVPDSAHGAPKKPPSPLSNLSSTPSLPHSPRETTSSTSRQDLYDLPTSSAAELPPPKSVRAPLLRKTYSKVRRTLRMTRTAIASCRQQHHDRYDPGSTDELAKSPSRGTFNSSMLISRTSVGRSGRLSDSSVRGNQLLFDNMAFAISFQARRDDETEDEYRERCSMSEELCDVVSRAGGKILANGFNELLDPATLKQWPVVQSSGHGGAAGNDESDFTLELGQQAKGLGFTALLADGHSRKVKYMQALALGLPCLAYQWATACLEKGEILDWSPYLLCAGQSVCVGNAILSRHLVPYSAIGAALADVVSQRTELLGSDRILLVMKKSRVEETKMAYLLLARILGARLIRAYNIRDARNALRRSEARDQKFDWVYVDEETGSVEQLFSAKAPEEKTASKKKRKRSGGGGSQVAVEQDGPAPGRVRCLSNELVIQSLIMGRIIDEDERAFTSL